MSEELEQIKDSENYVEIAGKKRLIKFTFSAWAKLEEIYGGISNFDAMEEDLKNKPFKTIPKLIWIGLRDKEDLDEETFLDDYDMDKIDELSTVLGKAIQDSLPTEKKKSSKSSIPAPTNKKK